MEFYRGDIVNLFNENYLDQYKANKGQRNLSLLDKRGHPGIIIAGKESWNVLPTNVYIIAKGQTLDPFSPSYKLFLENIDNGIATKVDIPQENNTTYMFSGELYIVDMNQSLHNSPCILAWKDWENPIPLKVTNHDLLSITTCIIKSQRELLTKFTHLEDRLLDAFLDVYNNINVERYVKQDLMRAYPIFLSYKEIKKQYYHPGNNLLKQQDTDINISGKQIQFEEAYNKIKTLIVKEFELLEKEVTNNNSTEEQQTMYNKLATIRDRNNNDRDC